MRPRHLPLDVLRGLAIAQVLVFHFHTPGGHAVVDALAGAGWAGVDLFFVLSGYLVGGMILAEAARTGRLDRRRFFVRRALRLGPVLALYLAILLVAGAGWRTVGPVVLHIQNYADAWPVPSHLWSLAVEEHFYLFAALALPALVRRGLVIPVLVAIIVAVGALRIGALAHGETLRHAQWQTQYRIDAPAAGVLLAALRRYRPVGFAAAGRHRALLIVGAVAAYAWLASLSEAATLYGAGRSVALLAAAALVLVAATTDARAAPRPTVRALGWLGTIAYPLYVWHASAGRVAEMLGGGIAAKLALAILTGAVVHRYVERPILLLREWLNDNATRLQNNQLVVAGPPQTA